VIRINRHFSFEDIGDESSYEVDDERRKTGYHQLIDPNESPQASVERRELNAQIELGLRALPLEQQLVLILSDIHGYSYQEISEITGFPMGTVKSRISRARLRLRDFLLQQSELVSFGLRN
jgi:RNA polymerase sigma-70 factor (ECF subfamily)